MRLTLLLFATVCGWPTLAAAQAPLPAGQPVAAAPPSAPAVVPAAPPVATEPVSLTTPDVARWAFVERSAIARATPADDAAAVARLARLTPERTPNLVLVLERVTVSGEQWLRVRLPVLPNNSTGWVKRRTLGAYEEVRTHLRVDTTRLTLRLERSGRTIMRARIAVGRDRWPTPAGEFYVRNVLHGFDDPTYGPVAFGTSARSTVLTDWPGGGFVGIHGTDQPKLVPGRVSHGCIRLHNRDVLRLARLMPVGTPVTISA